MRSVADVELATLGRIDSYNHRRLRRALDYRPPAEYEGEQTRKIVLAPARDSMNRVSTKLGGVNAGCPDRGESTLRYILVAVAIL